MAKRLILAVAGSGKTYTIANDLDPTKVNFLVTYTNENVKNIEKEILKRFEKMPDNTYVMTFDKFLIRYVLFPNAKKVLENEFEYNGSSPTINIHIQPEPKSINNYSNPNYKSISEIGHYMIDEAFYISRMYKFIYKYKLVKMAEETLNFNIDCFYVDEFQDFYGFKYKVLIELVKCFNESCMVGDFYQSQVAFNGSEDSVGRPYKVKKNYLDYKSYKDLLRKDFKGLDIDDVSLSQTRRCSTSVSKFVSEKMGINLSTHIEKEDDIGDVTFVNREDLIQVLNDDNIVKLVPGDSDNYKLYSINDTYSKGDTFDSVAILLRRKFENIDQDDFVVSDIKDSTRNKMYVALTRAKKDVFIIKPSLFELVKSDYYEPKERYKKVTGWSKSMKGNWKIKKKKWTITIFEKRGKFSISMKKENSDVRYKNGFDSVESAMEFVENSKLFS